jgi:hypothetical protein
MVDFFQRGPLLVAVRSPSGPEIQHNKFAFEITQASFFPL